MFSLVAASNLRLLYTFCLHRHTPAPSAASGGWQLDLPPLFARFSSSSRFTDAITLFTTRTGCDTGMSSSNDGGRSMTCEGL